MAKILITDPAHPLAEGLASLLRGAGHEVLLAPGNASSQEEVRELLKKTGAPDLLILSEYSSLREELAGGSADAIAREVENKLTSAFLYAKHFGAKMAEGGKGGILILGSLAADKPTGAIPAYGMIQGALQMMMKELALFFGNYGVRVNMLKLAPSKEEDEVFASNLIRAYYDPETKTPLKSRVTAEDAFGAVEYFLSPAARMVNGADLRIDGGLLCYYFDRAYKPLREEEL